MKTSSALLAVWGVFALAACADGKKNDNNNNLPDAGQDGGSPAPILQGVAPVEGPLAGGTQLELTGQHFVQGMTISVGGKDCTSATVLSAASASCVTPAGDALGPVAVRVENPDSQWSQLSGAFTYNDVTLPEVTWCVLDRPASLSAERQVATAPIYGRVHAEGLTDQTGRGAGITGQVGYGPVGSDPASGTGWIWVPAIYATDASAMYDEYVASLTVSTAGTYDVAYRFSSGGQWLYCDRDSSDNGYQPAQALALTVTAGADPMPEWCGLIQPLSTSTTVGVATADVTGQVFAPGITEASGAGSGVEAELGFGPSGTHPGVDPGWHFVAGAYQGDVGNNDEYRASMTAPAPGTFDYAWRFRLGAGPWLYCDANGSSDGYSSSHAGVMTVTGQPTQSVNWCNLQHPPSATVEQGAETELLFGRVYVEGITEGNGQGTGLLAEVGYGEVGSDPSSHGSWQWTAAAYNLSVDGLIPGGLANDEYMARLTVSTPGLYDFAYRFSADAGATWLYCDLDGATSAAEYSAAQAGELTVTSTTTTITLTAVTHPRGSILGGDTVTLTGTGFTASTTVTFGGVASPTVNFVSSTQLTAQTPPGAALGPVNVVVTNPGPTSATLASGFEYLLVFSPTVDGALAEWPTACRVAANTVATDWGVGQNELTHLYVAFDQNNLYLGVDGTVEANNAILAVVDLDFGASTGVSDFSSVTDSSGSLDVVIAGTLNITTAGFGAEVVMGTKGMAEVMAGTSTEAGWRGLSPLGDLPWLTGTVDTGAHAVEASIPLATLWTSGVPSGGATVAVTVKLGDYEGSSWAIQALPEQAGSSTVTQVFSFRIFPAGSF
ncbi:MAG: IPT/TIG domain-containing protein [Polyangia bacterium]|jgi:hypothetical protein|nr:IPT/TIG domain-containing protein [Polyangia bacterium]